MPNSDRFVVPITMKPASRSRRTRYALCVGRCSVRKREARFMHSPATAVLAFTATGTPANGRGSPLLT